ncbi:MAG: RelA/SpoT family protein [Nitrospirota bacterium]|jgi:GTP pyrophosphokinase
MTTATNHSVVAFAGIAERALTYNPHADLGLLEHAYRFAEAAHEGQVRRSGEPYFSHPVAVVEILLDLRLDIPTLCAALLHDTVEDTGTPLAEIQRLFGEEVAQLVDGVTKVATLGHTSRAHRTATNLCKTVEAMVRDIRVALIKIADRTHNMRTIDALSQHKKVRIAAETRDIYVPIAVGLGLGVIYPELQDRCFAILNPQDYEEIVSIFDYARERVHHRGEMLRDDFLECLGGRFPGTRTMIGCCRPHEVHRIHRHLGDPIERVAHILRFTVITPRDEDCYPLVGLLHGLRSPIPGRFKDYIATPRSNQYRALHTRMRGRGGCTVRTRILSEEMHAIAQRGITHQWAYKRGSDEAPADYARRMQWLQDLQECQQAQLCSEDFLKLVRGSLATDKVHPVTPRGDVLELPRGSTVLDFAFTIHTDLGWRCAGARVNGHRVGREYHLRDGDLVEILTDPAIEAGSSWLKHAQTPRARHALRSGLSSRKRERKLTIGRSRLINALHLPPDTDPAQREEVVGAAARLGFADIDAFLIQIGSGKFDVGRLLTAIGQQESEWREPEGAIVLALDNAHLYHLANCCRPLAGDDAIGFPSNRDGVIVHRATCHHAVRRSLDQQQTIPVRWQAGTAIGGRVGVVVELHNRQGALATVCTRIAEADANILKSRTLGIAPRYGSVHFEIEVRNLDHLNDVLEALRSADLVVSAERV